MFGYTAANDVSARDFQLRRQAVDPRQGADTFCPLGPVVVTTDEIPDPQHLPIACRVNGATMQDSNTREMIFPVPPSRRSSRGASRWSPATSS